MPRPRPNRILAALLVAVAGLSWSLPSASALPELPAPSGRIEPALARQLANGPAIAIMSWDESVAGRSAVQAHLAGAGLQATLFEGLPVAAACATTLADAVALARAPGARSVVSNQPLTPSLNKSVRTAFNGNPGAVWDGLGVTGQGMGIAVLDTGVDGRHPDVRFGTRMHDNVRVLYSNEELLGPSSDPCITNLYTSDFLGNMETTDTSSGHGTFMAGVAAGDGTASGGTYKGVAPQAEIIGVGAVDTVTARVDLMPGCAPRGGMTYGEDASCTAQPSTLGAIAGISYIITRQSFATVPTVVILAGWTLDGLYDPDHPLAQSISYVWENGISFVVPAGNKGAAMSDCANVSTCTFNPMAAGPMAIAVAAGTKTSRTTLEAYSSRGDPALHTYHGATFRYQPTLTAPGSATAPRATVATASMMPTSSLNWLGAGGGAKGARTDTSYVEMSGTSVAAAHVAGAIALMQEAAMDAKGYLLPPDRIRQILQQTATPMSNYASWEVGAGMIDITQAVALARFS